PHATALLSRVSLRRRPPPTAPLLPYTTLFRSGALPFAELGLDFFTPGGASFTLFARGEWQRENHIVPFATPAKLFLLGVRTGSLDRKSTRLNSSHVKPRMPSSA